eukprot:Hpha_TRINITY_DN3603_c0_g1::TRINITY_DN3603_c0_g1_i1::g.979::m.979
MRFPSRPQRLLRSRRWLSTPPPPRRKQAGDAHSQVGDRALWLAVTWPQGMLFGAGAMMASALLMWAFREPLTVNTAEQTAQVARNVLADDRVQGGATEFSHGVVSRFLESEDCVERLLGLLRKLVGEERTVEVVSELLRRLYDHPRVIENTRVLTARLMEDEGVQETVALLLRRVLLRTLDEVGNWVPRWA